MRAIKCGEASADSIRRNVEQAEEMLQTLLPEIQNSAVNAELGLKNTLEMENWKRWAASAATINDGLEPGHGLQDL